MGEGRGAAEQGRLAGQVALVTGAASGIGAAVARRFAEEGARVVGADLAEIPAAPGIEPQVLDVAEPASVEAAVAAVLARHGRVDSLVHAAGIGQEIPQGDSVLTARPNMMYVEAGLAAVSCRRPGELNRPDRL